MNLKVKKISQTAKLPERAYNSDAGLDIFADIACTIPVKATAKIDTGLSLELELDKDDFHTYAIFVHERSSLGSKGLARRAGLIDMAYRGPVVICLTNHSDKPYQVLKGDKIAQLVIQRVETPTVLEVSELNNTLRGENGFGSTGK